MTKLEFTTDAVLHREAKKIVFEFDDDLTIHEFKSVCMRLAAAMGYVNSSIKTSFGEEYDGDRASELEEIFNNVKFYDVIVKNNRLI